MLDANPAYRPMMVIDVEHSAGRGDVALINNRAMLLGVLCDVFSESRVDWDSCHSQDTGDGVQLVIDAEVPKARLIHPLVHDLAIRLRAHNQTAGSLTAIRVRVGLHAGDVHMSDGQVAGSSLEFLARLVEAPPLRQALALAPESVTLALAVSEHVYEEVVRHRYPGIDPDTFHRVTFTVKETKSRAWLHLPGCVQLPGSSTSGEHAREAVSGAAGEDSLTGGGFAVRAESVNIATDRARVGEQIGRIGARVDHVTGPVHLGTTVAASDDLRRRVAELRLAMEAYRRDGVLDEDTFAEVADELGVVEAHVDATDAEGQGRRIRALKKLKALVEDIADLAAKVAAVITAVRS